MASKDTDNVLTFVNGGGVKPLTLFQEKSVHLMRNIQITIL